MTDRSPATRPGPRRRRLLRVAGATALGSLAGCTGLFDRQNPGTETESPGGGSPAETPELIGSARAGRGLPGGTPMAAMPELGGELTVYSGRGEFLVGQLMGFIRERYPDLQLDVRYGGAADLANQIRTEGPATPADVFFTVNAGILGLLAAEDRLQSLPDDVLALGRDGYQDPDGRWIGTSGRVRTVPYNADTLSADDVPDDIAAFPQQDHLRDAMGWAPTYGSFQGMITAMRILDGDDQTRAWLRGMQDLGVQEYSSEFQVAQAVADGEVRAGFTNHYYPLRVLEARPSAPVVLGFTREDAGSFFNVAGAGVVDAAADPSLAANFVRHLLSAEAQDYFARSATFEYPMIPEVEPIERLPGFAELDPPDLDFAAFARADVNETIALMEEVGVL